MSLHFFVKWLVILVLSLGGVIGLLSYWNIGKGHALFYWVSLVLFSALSGWMYGKGSQVVSDKDKNKFTRLVLLSTMVKMVLTIILFIFYVETFAPADHTFVLPFLLIYIGFTIFEAHFMTKLGKTPLGK